MFALKAGTLSDFEGRFLESLPIIKVALKIFNFLIINLFAFDGGENQGRLFVPGKLYLGVCNICESTSRIPRQISSLFTTYFQPVHTVNEFLDDFGYELKFLFRKDHAHILFTTSVLFVHR
jgi:hypothetical protein